MSGCEAVFERRCYSNSDPLLNRQGQPMDLPKTSFLNGLVAYRNIFCDRYQLLAGATS